MKKQILIINNSKAIRFLLQTVMENEFHVISVTDGYSAIRLLAKRDFPDLIITDTQFPDMGDWELIQHLSSNGIYNSIPVVVLSGLDEEETTAKCIEYGVHKFFIKPFDPVELMTSVNDVIQNNQVYQGYPAKFA